MHAIKLLKDGHSCDIQQSQIGFDAQSSSLKTKIFNLNPMKIQLLFKQCEILYICSIYP